MRKLRNILLTFLSLSIPAYAVVIVVPDGTTETATVTVDDPGDILIIEEGGAIDPTTDGDDGVTMNATNQTTLNQGSITTVSTAADNGRGIFNDFGSNNAVIINSAQISTTGVEGQGIRNDGSDVVITNNGQISTTGDEGQGINNSGQRSVIRNSGRISTTGVAATGILNGFGSNNVVIANSGQISTSGNDADGIFTGSADNAVITNSGQILTEGSNASGIRNNVQNARITNDGKILTSGSSVSHGIVSLALFSEITNNGQISITGPNAIGITSGTAALVSNIVITNNGLILTTASNSTGIQNLESQNVRITNNGQILTEENNSFGIRNNIADNVTITNSGQISTAASFGILSQDSDNVNVINSGTIKAPLRAIFITGGTTSTTLSLLRGSNLQGFVRVLDNPLTLNVETGLNLALTLDSSSVGFASFGITAPFATLGSTVGVIDPTGLALQADVVADMSDAILDGIYRRKVSLTCPCIAYGSGAWAQGLGSYRKRSREKNTVGYDNWQGGFLIGYDTICGEGNIGLFGGAAYGEAEVDQQTQQADFTSYVAGVTYERLSCNTFFGCALAVGSVKWDNQRLVMNNLAPGGVDTAKADADGVFVSPEATLAYRFFSLWYQPVMTFTMRYAGLYLGDYAEQGSLTNLAVQDRHVDLLTGRLELALPYTTSCDAGCVNFEPYVGVYRRYQVGGKGIKSQFLGQTLRFNPGSPPTLVALLVGLRTIQSFDTFNLFVNLEASFDDHSSSRILGEAGFGFSF